MIINADCLKHLRTMGSNSVDSLVTDPPAGISFMGKAWDSDKGGRDEWIAWLSEVMRECLRVLKPGAHGLVWAIPRTSHWTAMALEQAGFEVRDCVTHLFGTGFPKSLDVSKAIDRAAGARRDVLGASGNARPNSDRGNGLAHGVYGKTWDETAPVTDSARQWQGWGTALKPACEFWWLVRKPLDEKTVAANVLKHGTGALNIDGCRIAAPGGLTKGGNCVGNSALHMNKDAGISEARQRSEEHVSGRFPANLVLDEEAAAMLDEQAGYLHGAGNKRLGPPPGKTETSMFGLGGAGKAPDNIYDRGGNASRFFYCAKASKSDRGTDNKHPTVKSTKLMGYLCRLVTPPGGTVLDPFMGSGSTGVAATAEGFQFIGIEQDTSYAEIAAKRIG